MTTLLEQLQIDVKDAMKARDTDRVQSLRLFVNAVQVDAKSKQRELTDDEIVTVLQREKKKRVEAAEAFETAGHHDRAGAERAQSAMLDAYLPEQLSPEALDVLVAEAVAEAGATSPSQMGAVMKLAIPMVAGRADGKAISAAVSRALK